MASINALGGGVEFSGCFTIIMNRIVFSPFGLTGVFRRVIFGSMNASNEVQINRQAFKLFIFSAELLIRFRGLRTQSFFLGSEFRSKLDAKIEGLEYWANFDFGPAIKWGALKPLYGFFDGRNLPEPVARDEFFGLSERAVGYGALLSRKLDALAFGAGMQAIRCEQGAGFN
jgi:hypothetical protein